MSTKYVILDCDGGSDDAWALLLLLHAERSGLLKLLGVTTSGCGNTTREHAARNMRRITIAYDRMDLPVFLGAVEPMVSESVNDKKFFHGRDGFGDCLDDMDVGNLEHFVQKQHAVTAIYELCKEHSKQVTVFAVGPLTNLALGYAMYGQQFGDHFKELYIMGGNYRGVGNSSRAAEFNFHSDPEAAHAVLLKTRCPITILPWEPCTDEHFKISIKWRFLHFGVRAADAKHMAITMLNKVESAQWHPMEQFEYWNPCDALVVAAWLFEQQFVKKHSSWHVTVDLNGAHTRGQMVLDHLREREKYPENVRILELVDDEFFKCIVEWVAGLRNKP